LQPPSNKIDEFRGYVESINRVVVGGSKAGTSIIFSGDVSSIDPYKLD
jgi:hypothetical protein